MILRLIAATFTAALLSACANPTRSDAPAPAVAAVPAPQVRHTVAERFVSPSHPADELDSLATWPAPDGSTWLIASAKSSHRLVVFDADRGTRLRAVGGPGAGAGQFKRPNGVAVHGDHLFVVERDNGRAQAFALPGFTPLGTFGDAQLRSPYGLWLNEIAPDELDVYVTDSFMYGADFTLVPALDELDQRVRRYRLRIGDDDAITARYAGSFGDTSQAGALRVVESIAGDGANDRLLIADERAVDIHGRAASTLREYRLNGTYTGRSLPPEQFAGEAEGVALWSCRDGAGYWIAVDQLQPLTVFHLFERRSLRLAGSFQGAITANSDGIAVHAAGTAAFPHGALFAVHDDRAVAAFDLGEIAKRLNLAPECSG